MTVNVNSSHSHDWIRSIVLVVALFNMSSLSSCTVPTKVIFKNGTQHYITLDFKGAEGKPVSVLIGPNSNDEVDSLFNKHFSVLYEGKKLNYGVEQIPESFINIEGIGPFYKRILQVEFIDTGCIYLTAPSDNLNTTRANQPEGFPLCSANN